MKTYRQLLAFLLVGALNTLFGYSLYGAFIFIGMDYWLAVLISTILGVLFNFKTTGQFVFNNTDNSFFIKYAMVYAFVYLFNIVVIKSMQLFTNNLYYAGIVAMIPAAIIAFILTKLFVFKDEYEIN